MIFNNLPYCPEDFAGKILVETLNLSPKTKAFLKEEAKINTVLELSRLKLDQKTIAFLPKQIKREIIDFKNWIKEWMKTRTQGLRFSKNIPPPRKKPKSEEKATLIALLLGEPLFGNRRNISLAKVKHLPNLYPGTEDRKNRKNHSSKSLRKLKIAS